MDTSGRPAADQLAAHLVAAIVAHVRQLHRDGQPVPAGLWHLARMLADARHSPPNVDAGHRRRDAPAMPPVTVDYATAAAALGVSPRTISRRVHAGELPVVGTGRGRRIPTAALAAYAQEGL